CKDHESFIRKANAGDADQPAQDEVREKKAGGKDRNEKRAAWGEPFAGPSRRQEHESLSDHQNSKPDPITCFFVDCKGVFEIKSASLSPPPFAVKDQQEGRCQDEKDQRIQTNGRGGPEFHGRTPSRSKASEVIRAITEMFSIFASCGLRVVPPLNTDY